MAGSIVRRDTLNEVSPWRQDTFMSFYKMNRLPRGSVRWENFYHWLAEKLRQLVGTCFLAETNKFKSSGIPTEVIFRIRSVVLCTHPEGRQGRDGRGVCVCVCVHVRARTRISVSLLLTDSLNTCFLGSYHAQCSRPGYLIVSKNPEY